MTIFYSDYNCSSCNNLEKVLVDYEDNYNHLVMPGQPSDVNDICETVCPYCNSHNKSNIISKNGYFVGIFDVANIHDDKDVLSYEQTLDKWQNENRTLFVFDEPFTNHPYSPKDTITLGNDDYTVQQTFIREWIESDPDIRLELNKGYAYCYSLIDKKGEQCWLQVEVGATDNAFLNYKEGFIVRDTKDEFFDISDDTSYPLEIFKSDWIDDLELSVRQFKSGYEFVVTNPNNEATFNGFYTSFDEGFKDFEANITLTL